MKTQHLLLLIGLAIGIIQCTNNSEESTLTTPQQVLTAFEKMFPNAQEVEWEKGEKDTWEVEFKTNEKSIEVEFSSEGTWLQTETELRKADVPKMATDAILAKYPKCEWREFEEIRSENFLAYEVDIIHQGKEVEILITGSGEILEDEVEDNEPELEV